MYLVILSLIISIASVTIRFWAVAICLGKGKRTVRLLIIFNTIDNLALAVRREVLESLGLTPPVAETQSKGCSFNRLTRRGINHHITYRTVWLVLHDNTHTRHEIQRTRHLRVRLRLKFHHIHTSRQSIKQY